MISQRAVADRDQTTCAGRRSARGRRQMWQQNRRPHTPWPRAGSRCFWDACTVCCSLKACAHRNAKWPQKSRRASPARRCAASRLRLRVRAHSVAVRGRTQAGERFRHHDIMRHVQARSSGETRCFTTSSNWRLMRATNSSSHAGDAIAAHRSAEEASGTHGSPPPRDQDTAATASPCGQTPKTNFTLQKTAAPSRSEASMRPPPPRSEARINLHLNPLKLRSRALQWLEIREMQVSDQSPAHIVT